MKRELILIKKIILALVILTVVVNSTVVFSVDNKFNLNGEGDLISNSKVVVSGYKFYKIFNYDDFDYLIASSRKDKQLYLINKKNYKVERLTDKRPMHGSYYRYNGNYYLDKCYLTYRYGKVYYLDGEWPNFQIKYSDGKVIKLLEAGGEDHILEDENIKFSGDNMYYILDQDYCHIDLKTAKKVVDIQGTESNTFFQIVYQDKNKMLYKKGGWVFLKKGEETVKLFSMDPNIYLSYNNMLIDKNNYYFITGLSNGIYLYNVKNDSCKNILHDKILAYDIKEARAQVGSDTGKITEFKLRYFNSNCDLKLFDLKTHVTKLLIPGNKVVERLRAAVKSVRIV